MEERRRNRLHNNKDTLLIVLLCVCFFALLLAFMVPRFMEFSQTRKYLREEIRRTSGEDRARWKKKRRKSWRILLPFGRYED